jgi:hypothetical protein
MVTVTGYLHLSDGTAIILAGNWPALAVKEYEVAKHDGKATFGVFDWDGIEHVIATDQFVQVEEKR